MLFRHSLVYLAGRLIPAGLGFVVIAVYANFLTPAEYGLVALVNTGVQLAWMTLFMPLCQASLRFGHTKECQDRILPSLLQLNLTVAGGLAAAAAIVLMAFDLGPYQVLVVLGLLLLLATVWMELQLHLQIGRSDAMGYARQSVIRTTVAATLGCLAAWAGWGAAGVVGGMILGMALPGLFLHSIRVDPRALLRLDRESLRDLSRYAAPLSPSAAFGSLGMQGDRLIIGLFHGTEAVGLYSMAHDVTMRILQAIGAPIGAAALPLAIRAMETRGPEQARMQLATNFSLLAGVLIPAAVGFAVISPLFADVLMGPEFERSASLIIPILAIGALAGIFRGNYVDHSFQLASKTSLLLAISASVLALNVGLNLLLTPFFMVQGPAVAMLVSQAGGLALAVALCRRGFRLPFPHADFTKVTAATLAMVIAMLSLPHGEGATQLALEIALGGSVYLLCAAALDIGGIGRYLRRRLFPAARVAASDER